MNTPPEEWRRIAGWPYEISNLGNVRHADTKRPRRLKLQSLYLAFTARKPRTGDEPFRRTLYVHRAVCEAFNGVSPGDNYEVCHCDGDRMNNRSENLRWDTHKGNHADRLAHGTLRLGRNHQNAKITEETAARIRLMWASKAASLSGIASALNVNASTVRNVIYRGDWTHGASFSTANNQPPPQTTETA